MVDPQPAHEDPSAAPGGALRPRDGDLGSELAERRVGNFVFIGLRGGKPPSRMAVWTQCRRATGDEASPHGFRSSFRSWCADNGVPRDVAEAALAHVVKGVEGSYQRSDLLERRRPSDAGLVRLSRRQERGGQCSPAQGQRLMIRIHHRRGLRRNRRHDASRQVTRFEAVRRPPVQPDEDLAGLAPLNAPAACASRARGPPSRPQARSGARPARWPRPRSAASRMMVSLRSSPRRRSAVCSAEIASANFNGRDGRFKAGKRSSFPGSPRHPFTGGLARAKA